MIAVRVALPEVLRRVIISQASQALNARVDVGDVDLRLWRGGVALEDVAVREKDAPEPPPPPKDVPKDAPPPPAFDAYSPVIGFKRLAVELRYWPLFRKTIQLRDIELDAPRVSLDRLASGDLNVLALVPRQQVAVEAGGTPGPAATPTTAATAAEGTPWAFGLDKFILTDGRIRFRDLALQGTEPVELGIDRISVDEIALTPSVYGKPATIAVKLGVDEGTIDVTANLTLNGSTVSAVTHITANNLPLRRARLYVPKVGWSDLKGELDLGLTYELEPEKTNALHGTIGLRDVSVAVPTLQGVAVGWKSLAVDLDRIDLLTQRAAVREVALDGAVVAVHVEGGELLPALAPPGTAAAAPPSDTPGEGTPPAESATAPPETAVSPGETPASTATGVAEATAAETAAEPSPTPSAAQTEGASESEPSPTPTSSPAAGTPAAAESPAAEATPPPKPWGWQVEVIKITDSTLRAVGDLPTLDLGITLDGAKLTGDADAIGHVTLGVAVESGTLTLDGDLRIAPVPAFGGTLKIADLPIPSLPVVRRLLPHEVMPSGTLRSDLAITAGLPAASGGQARADRLGISGTIGVAALQLSPPQVPGLAVTLPDLDLRVDRLEVPGVIPPGQKAPAGAAIDLAATLALREPHVVRTGDQPLDVAAQSITLTVPSMSVPAALAKLGPGDEVAIVNGEVGLDLGAPRVALGDAMSFQADTVGVRATEVKLPVLNAPPAPAAAAPPSEGEPTPVLAAAPAAPPAVPIAAPPATFDLKLDLAAAKVTIAQGKELDAGLQTLALQLTDIVVPGFVAGAPLAPSAEPLHEGRRWR